METRKSTLEARNAKIQLANWLRTFEFQFSTAQWLDGPMTR